MVLAVLNQIYVQKEVHRIEFENLSTCDLNFKTNFESKNHILMVLLDISHHRSSQSDHIMETIVGKGKVCGLCPCRAEKEKQL